METEQSSEVKEEQELTQEALDDAKAEEEKTSPAEVEPFSPEAIAAISKQRSEKQDALVAQARAEGKLEALQSQNIKTATVSPIDVEIARQKAEGIEEEDMQISPAVIKADKLFEQQQTANAAEAQASQQLGVLQVASLNTAKLVHDDWQETINNGQTLLTSNEAKYLAGTGDGFGELAYELCQKAIARSKPDTKTEAAPETELSKSEAEAKGKAAAEVKKKEELASQEDMLKHEVDNPAIAAAMKL